MVKYLPRMHDDILPERLEGSGAILLEGPKWCGKTTTAAHVAASVIYLHDPATRQRNLTLASAEPQRLLAGKTPRLIDEWQDAPQLWDAIRFEIDQRQEVGQFILTGSSVPANLDSIAHSGAGRIARLRMYPMSLWESQESTGDVSLSALFNGEELPLATCESSIDELAYLVCRGGWPRSVTLKHRAALRQAYDYIDTVVEIDLLRIDNVSRNPDKGRALLRSYARMVSSEASYTTMRADLAAGNNDMGESSFAEYVGALRRMFVLEDMNAWNPKLRSKAAVRTSPVRHFCDPSLAAAALGATPSRLIDDTDTFGLLFEDMCVRDLRVYSQKIDGTVSHYRDSSGLECDAVVHLRDGRYGLIEVKLGGDTLIDEGAKSLTKLAAKIDAEAMGEPVFLMVLVGVGDMAYVRPDGVMVVPIKCLRD